MHMLFRLFGPRRRKNQEEIAGRAAEIILQVLFDVGVDRFVDGSVLLDQNFRLRFYAVPPRGARGILASVAVAELGAAREFRTQVHDAGLNAPTVLRQAQLLVDELMRELRARSPALRALPLSRSKGAGKGDRDAGAG